MSGALLPLARGGLVVETSEGPLQFGAVPETIKDTLPTSGGVPRMYLIPDRLFDSLRGISLADLEFPIYFNFFARRQKTICICQPGQRRAIATVMREAVFGPARVDVTSEVFAGPVPDLSAEMAYFRENPFTGKRTELDDMLEFVVFDRSDRASIGNVEIRRGPHGYTVSDSGKVLAEFAAIPPIPEPMPEPAERTVPFQPPAFGITFIGTGHGFDPNTMTSGFIIWANHRGILVDPPVNSTEWMKQQEINPKLIDSILLTHCHADHDGGTLQKILSEGRVHVYATPTILGSFIQKYRQLVEMDRKSFELLFDYVPITIGAPVRIHGAEFYFHYTLHSVPCVGFEVFHAGKSLVYTSDTLYDPGVFSALFEAGILDEERRDQLLNFPWHHDLVLHEAGIPPIHTRSEQLAALDPAVKERLMLIHISPKNLPEGSGLKIAPAGLESTVPLVENAGSRSEPQEILEVLSRVDLFRDFPLARAAELYSMVRRKTFAAGDRVIEKGTYGDYFYMISSGKAVVRASQSADEQLVYGPSDYFGETALVLDVPRTADVWAKTDLEVLTIGRHDFLYCVRGTALPTTLRRLAHMRRLDSWELLDACSAFGQLTATQKTQLQSIMEDLTVEEGATLVEAGERVKYAYLVAKGQVEVLGDGRRQKLLRKGDFSGQTSALLASSPSPHTLRALTDALVYRMSRRGMATFLRRNPGIFVRLSEAQRNGHGQ